MIKSNITVEVNSTELDGVLIVPSAVFTSTVQEEELDLTKTPNFQIVVGKGDEINDTVEVSFTAEEVEYTANMKVVNRNGSTVTLQYVDGLTAEDVPEQSVAPTITYNNETFTVSATGEGTVKMYVDSVETVSPHTFDSVGTYVVTATAEQDGKTISDTVTENITITKTATPTISYDSTTFTVSASGNGTVTMYVDGVATVSPHTFTQGQSAVTYTVTATAIETGKFLSDTATENCLVPANAPDPLDSPIEISGQLTSESYDSYDSIVYSQETNDVYMRSAGMTYDSTNDRYVFASNVQDAVQQYYVPSTHTIETITFVNLDSTYKAELLQMGDIGYGTVSTDQSGNLVWTRTIDYNPNDGLSFDFTGIIQTVGADMTCQKMILTLAEYVARPLYILGNINGQSWGPNIGTEMNFDSSLDMYTLTITAPANEAGTFSFSKQLASQGGNDGWEEISYYRYGPIDETYQVQEGVDSHPFDHGTYSFEIQAGTEYNISIDSGLNTIEFEQVMPEEPEE